MGSGVVGAPGVAGGGQRPQGGDRLVGEAGPRLFLIQGQHRLPAVAGEGGGDREQPQAQPLGFPAAGVRPGQGDQLHPGRTSAAGRQMPA